MQDTVDQYICDECGYTSPVYNEYCPECGTPIASVNGKESVNNDEDSDLIDAESLNDDGSESLEKLREKEEQEEDDFYYNNDDS